MENTNSDLYLSVEDLAHDLRRLSKLDWGSIAGYRVCVDGKYVYNVEVDHESKKVDLWTME